MAASKWMMYETAALWIHDGTLDLDLNTNWKCALFDIAGNADDLTLASPIYGNLTNEVANGNGYTTGGVALTGVVATESGGVLTFDFDDPTWTASGGNLSAGVAVIYKDATVNSIVKPAVLTCYLDYNAGSPQAVTALNGNPLQIQIHANGAYRFTAPSAAT